MPDLHGWISQQIEETERVARDAGGKAWQWEHGYGDMCNDPTCPYGELATDDASLMEVHGYDVTAPWQGAAHIALHDPAAVLRRCAADRKILARHCLDPDAYWSERAMCQGCGTTGDCDWPVTDNLNDCPELLDLAEGYGLTPELLATLDRPQRGERPEPTGPGLIPDAVAGAFYGPLLQMVLNSETYPIEPRLHVKVVGAPIEMPAWLREDLGLPAPPPEPTPGERAFAVVEPHLSSLALYQPDTDPEA